MRHHYRRMLPLILDTLVFRSNNSGHRPVIEALNWARAHREDRRTLVPCSEIPIVGVVRAQMQEILDVAKWLPTEGKSLDGEQGP